MRCNLIGLCGFTLSLMAAAIFIAAFWLESSSWGSGDSQLRHDMLGLQLSLGLLYFVGVGISGFSPLGSLVQLPSLGVLLPLAWYLDYTDSAAGYGMYTLAFIANFILLTSLFVGIECPGRRLTIPPESRIRWWSVHASRSTSRPFSKSARVAIVTIIAASVLILASFTYYVRANDVSRLTVVVMINGAYYGSVEFAVYLDGEAVDSRALVYDGGHFAMDAWLYLELPSGSHMLEMDVWNGSAELSVGVIDSMTQVKTLPFAEEMTFLTLGVYLI